MGQIIAPGKDGRSIKIYSKSFPQSKHRRAADELYLDDYGDQLDIENPSQHEIPRDFGTNEQRDEDDYPTESLHVDLSISVADRLKSLSVAEPLAVKNDFRSESTSQLMEEAHQTTKQSLDSQYRPLLSSDGCCEEVREDLKRCYSNQSDLLNCKEQVASYSNCARVAVARAIS